MAIGKRPIKGLLRHELVPVRPLRTSIVYTSDDWLFFLLRGIRLTEVDA